MTTLPTRLRVSPEQGRFAPLTAGLAAGLMALLLLSSARAATSTKLNNATDLDTAGSWSGGVPGTGDVALWDGTLTGPNTVALGSNLSVGQIKIVNPNGLVTITAGSTLTLLANAGAATGIDMSVATANLTINASVRISASQIWDVGGSSTLTVNGSANDSNGPAKSLTKNGTGTLILAGANSYDGGTIMNAGLFVISGSSSAANGGTTINGGTLRATTNANALGNNVGSNFVFFTGGTLELANNTALAFNRDTTVSGNATILSDRLAAGAGVTQTMGALSIGAQTLNVGKGSFVTSGTAGLAFGATTLTASGAVFEVGSGALLTLASVTGTNRSFTVQGAGGTTIAGAVTTGTGTLTKSGTGTLTLSGANTYTGLTTVSAGTLAYGANNVISSGAVTVNGATAVLALGASRTDTVGTVTVDGGGSITGTGTSALTSTGTFEMKSGAVSGILAGAGIALNKTTTGTAVLTGANTFSGATTIAANGGMLTAGAADALRNTSAITVNNGGTLLLGGVGAINRVNDAAGFTLAGGTLSTAGLSNSSETLGALTLSANSTLDFGTGTGDHLAFAGVGAHTAGAVLSILNWSGTASTLGTSASDRLLFTGSASTFTSVYAQSDVVFAGFGTGYSAIQFGGQFEIVAVPEPATIFGALALVGLVGYRERRRLAVLIQRRVLD